MKKLILVLLGVGMISFSVSAQTSRTSRTRTTTTTNTNTPNRTITTQPTATAQPVNSGVQPLQLDTMVNRNLMNNKTMTTDQDRNNRVMYPNTPTNTTTPTNRRTNYNNTLQPNGTNGLPASPGNMNGTDFNNPNGNTNSNTPR